MRWKLLVLTSVVASIAGGALWSAIVALLFGPAAVMARRDWLLPVSLVVPVGIAVFAGYFVYRHTARRRKLQAALTVILSLILTIAFFVIGSIVTSRINPIHPQPGTQRNAT